MGADIKSLRTRIKSVTSTQQLTRAMGLVASSKIRKATERMLHGRDYAAALEQVLCALTAAPECAASPYMQVREGGRTRLIVIAGDRGLAGGYNANVFRTVREYPDAQVIPIGKRACDRFGGEMRSCEKMDSRDAYDLAASLCEDFANGEYDRLGILYTQYVSMMSQQPEILWILPLTRQEGDPTGAFPLALQAIRFSETGEPSRAFVLGCSTLLTSTQIYAMTDAQPFIIRMVEHLFGEEPIDLSIMPKAALRPQLTAESIGLGSMILVSLPLAVLAAALIVLVPRRHR